MTPLRQQMLRAMDLKNLSPHTRRSYLSAVTNLAKHYQQSPETISPEIDGVAGTIGRYCNHR